MIICSLGIEPSQLELGHVSFIIVERIFRFLFSLIANLSSYEQAEWCLGVQSCGNSVLMCKWFIRIILAQLRLDTDSELRSRLQVEIEDSHCPYSKDLGRLIGFYI